MASPPRHVCCRRHELQQQLPGEPVDPALDQNEAELGVPVLPVPLEVLPANYLVDKTNTEALLDSRLLHIIKIRRKAAWVWFH